MTLAQLRTRIGGIIGLDTANSGTEQTLVDGWFNESVQKFLLETHMYVKAGAADFTAGQWEYDIDDDILDWDDMWIVRDSDGLSVIPERTSPAEILRMRALNAAVQQVAPIYVAVRGWNTLLVHPTPSSSDALHFMYVPRPAAMAATSDAPSLTANGGIPEQFHDILEAYVKWKAADYDDDTSSQVGAMYQAEWEAGLASARRAMNMRLGPSLPPAKVGKRRPFPVSRGVDLGLD